MSQKRKIRLAASACALTGTVLTTIVLVKPDAGLEDGSLFFPVAAVVGIATLISNRPGRTNA